MSAVYRRTAVARVWQERTNARAARSGEPMAAALKVAGGSQPRVSSERLRSAHPYPSAAPGASGGGGDGLLMSFNADNTVSLNTCSYPFLILIFVQRFLLWRQAVAQHPPRSRPHVDHPARTGSAWGWWNDFCSGELSRGHCGQIRQQSEDKSQHSSSSDLDIRYKNQSSILINILSRKEKVSFHAILFSSGLGAPLHFIMCEAWPFSNKL